MSISLIKPVQDSARLSDPFGWRGAIPGVIGAGLHNGQDWATHSGAPVYAAAGGTAYNLWEANGFGNFVMIEHGSGYVTYYAHLLGFSIKHGSRVKQGQIIGRVGSSGASNGPHLHFSLRINGTYVNPMPYITTTKGSVNTMAANFFARLNNQSKVYGKDMASGKVRAIGSVEWNMYQDAMRAAGQKVPITNVSSSRLKSVMGKSK